MGKAALVERDIEEGRRLVDLLVKSEVSVPLALWRYDSSHGDWRLVLALPQMARSSQEAYYFIGNVLKDMHTHLTIQDVSLISPDGDLVKVLRKEKNSARALKGQFLTGTRIGDAYFEGAYLYKVA